MGKKARQRTVFVIVFVNTNIEEFVTLSFTLIIFLLKWPITKGMSFW